MEKSSFILNTEIFSKVIKKTEMNNLSLTKNNLAQTRASIMLHDGLMQYSFLCSNP
jgi:hypothetical protein